MGRRTLSTTVRQGSMTASWKTMPLVRRGPSTRLPCQMMLASPGARSPASSSSRVLFPHPEGPRTDTNSLGATLRLISSRARTTSMPRPYAFDTPTISTSTRCPGALDRPAVAMVSERVIFDALAHGLPFGGSQRDLSGKPVGVKIAGRLGRLHAEIFHDLVLGRRHKPVLHVAQAGLLEVRREARRRVDKHSIFDEAAIAARCLVLFDHIEVNVGCIVRLQEAVFQALHGAIDERLALFRIFLNALLLGDDGIAVHF